MRYASSIRTRATKLKKVSIRGEKVIGTRNGSKVFGPPGDDVFPPVLELDVEEEPELPVPSSGRPVEVEVDVGGPLLDAEPSSFEVPLPSS